MNSSLGESSEWDDFPVCLTIMKGLGRKKREFENWFVLR
jgi:hypothetical protein